MHFQQRRTSRSSGRRGNNEGEEKFASSIWRPAFIRAGSTDAASADALVTTSLQSQRPKPDQSQNASMSSRRRPRQASKTSRKRLSSLVLYLLLSISGVCFFLNGAYILTRMPSFSITGPQSTVSSKVSYPRGRRAQGLRVDANELPSEEDEDWLLSRMVSAQDHRLIKCARYDPTIGSNATKLASSSSRRLRPFGLRSDLMSYRRSVRSDTYRRDTADAFHFEKPGNVTCRFITTSSQACGVSSYAIIATSTFPLSYDSTEDVELAAETLVLNCLQWLLDPSAGEVWILLPSHAESALKRPTSGRGYVSRLWEWDSISDHPVKLLFVSDPWIGMEAIYRRTREVVVVWRSGSRAFRGSVNETQTGFRRWKQSPVKLYALRARSFPSLAPIECAVADDNETLPAGRAKAAGIQPTTAWKIPDIADGLIHHISYLCFAGHPVTERIRFASAASNDTLSRGHSRPPWYDALLAISLWVTHASSSATTSSPGDWLQLYASQDLRAEGGQVDPGNVYSGAVGETEERWTLGSRTFADLVSYFGGIPMLLLTGESPRSSSTTCGISNSR